MSTLPSTLRAAAGSASSVMLWTVHAPFGEPTMKCAPRVVVETTGANVGSNSFADWQAGAKSRLDEIARAHGRVRGQGRGSRIAALQIRYAYTMLLTSNFQGFCRDLHTEAIDYVCKNVSEAWARRLLRDRLGENRKLDRGNPTPGNLGSDFGRLGLSLWDQMRRRDSRSHSRQSRLEELCRWRNAISHQDFTNGTGLDLGGGRLRLRFDDVESWRSACDALAATLDRVAHAQVVQLVGSSPWPYPGR